MSSPVGTLLAHWRAQRRMSQLVLAGEAGVTQRHVSFVESGRSHPSVEMVLSLARALDVPLRERNQMLLAAGYAPRYRETDVETMPEISAALSRVLEHQEPYPAVVMDRYWDISRANSAALAMFAFLLDGDIPSPANVVRLLFTRLRPFLANFEVTGEALLARVHREAVGGIPDPRTTALLDEALAQPGVPSGWRTPDFGVAAPPVLPVRFAKEGVEVSYFSLVTTVGTPQDVTLQEIRIESFIPADGPTAGYRWC
jgi:transcriptional regulator with XRE-family HTH domain